MERTQILVLLECRRNMESSLHFSESHSSCLQKKDAATHFAGLSSVQFSCSVLSDSLRPHGLQLARLPCPSPTPGACSNSWPLSQWCQSIISSSVSPFSFCLQSFPASGSFLISQFFASGGQSIGASASASNDYSGLISFRTDWFDLFAVQGILKSFLKHHSSKVSVLQCSAFFMVQLSHPFRTTGKTIVLTMQIFVGKVLLCFIIRWLGLSFLGTHFYLNLCLPTQIVIFHWDTLPPSTRTTYILTLALGLHSPREPVSSLNSSKLPLWWCILQ